MSDEKVGLEEQQDELWRGVLAVEYETSVQRQIDAIQAQAEAYVRALKLTQRILSARLHRIEPDAKLLSDYYAAQARLDDAEVALAEARNLVLQDQYRVHRYLGGGGFVDSEPEAARQGYTVEIKSKPEGEEPR